MPTYFVVEYILRTIGVPMMDCYFTSMGHWVTLEVPLSLLWLLKDLLNRRELYVSVSLFTLESLFFLDAANVSPRTSPLTPVNHHKWCNYKIQQRLLQDNMKLIPLVQMYKWLHSQVYYSWPLQSCFAYIHLRVMPGKPDGVWSQGVLQNSVPCESVLNK